MGDVSLPRRPARVEARDGTRALAAVAAANNGAPRSAGLADTGNARATFRRQRLEMAPPPLLLFVHSILIFLQPQDEIALPPKIGDLSAGYVCVTVAARASGSTVRYATMFPRRCATVDRACDIPAGIASVQVQM
jgi:hypothetical protein